MLEGCQSGELKSFTVVISICGCNLFQSLMVLEKNDQVYS